ncbi:Chromosome partioning protein ParB [Paraburkholderia piptadeniae]|uniref:Chromosome partioning protein ParB n=1 Tax=Paraburkholderia piptadeniae TaxID=1701573 RepID=A0A1N7SUY6_9BURK|nr:ParB/RepB/Spo0J family partition protein [Paraburkholderia piptadeniae]SIT51141.1 Chromosome partioning protein ParB [Paraburkholderia piptadeniae]
MRKDVTNNVAKISSEIADEAKTQIAYVPYWRLCPSPLNVRKRRPTGIESLAETIDAKGVMQNLVAHELKGRTKVPKLGVCAGQRRLAALDLLCEQGRITRDYLVPVLTVSEGEALAASLIENREREAMHIADECVAFRLLTEEGKSVAHIAALFKVPDIAVRRALKIANLSPVLLDLLRDDRLDYEQAKVLVLADDHATQERVWNDAHNAWQQRPSELRAAITTAEIDARANALAKFVGLEAYEAAGGYIRRDLFSDDQNAGYIEDADLLHRLATDRLIELSQAVCAEGWAWVETRTRYEALEIMRHDRIPSTTRQPTRAEADELAALVAKRDAAYMELNAYYDEDGEPDEARQDRLDAAVTAATYAVDQYAERFESFDADDMKGAGVFVYLDDDGQVCIERGLVRRDSASGQPASAHAVHQTATRERTPKERPLHGEKLCKRLTAHRTAAVQIELARQPGVALAALIFRMIPVVFDEVYGHAYIDQAVRIDVHTTRDALVSNADDMAESVAWNALEGERSKWARMLPKRTEELLTWLLRQDSDVMSNLFAFCVAATVDGISPADRAHPVNELANTLEVDLTRYWKATRAGYFEHVPKDRIVTVVGETVSAQAAGELRGMKKGDAAAASERRMTDSGWLPEVLRNRDVPERIAYGRWDDDGETSDEAETETASVETGDSPSDGEAEETEAA